MFFNIFVLHHDISGDILINMNMIVYDRRGMKTWSKG